MLPLLETYFTLMRDPNHWGFELTLEVLTGGVVGSLIWPRISKHFRSEKTEHGHDEAAVARIEALERAMNRHLFPGDISDREPDIYAAMAKVGADAYKSMPTGRKPSEPERFPLTYARRRFEGKL